MGARTVAILFKNTLMTFPSTPSSGSELFWVYQSTYEAGRNPAGLGFFKYYYSLHDMEVFSLRQYIISLIVLTISCRKYWDLSGTSNQMKETWKTYVTMYIMVEDKREREPVDSKFNSLPIKAALSVSYLKS